MNARLIQSIADKIRNGERDFGRVAVIQHDQFLQLCYTNAAMYGKRFTKKERVCRGLIVRDDGRVMAVPMEKFFNLGEPQCPPIPENEQYTIWEKIDGSLGIFWHDGKRWRCNTKRSFDNAYTRYALKQWHELFNESPPFPSHYTVMVEIVIPNDEMQRVAYKPPGIYLLALTNRYSCTDISITSYFDTMPHVQLVEATIDELLEHREKEEGLEGWVVRFDSGLRIKIKTKWYLRTFRAVQNLAPNNIRNLILSGDNWTNEFPDDLLPEAIQIRENIEKKLAKQLREIYDAYSKVAGIKSRKEYALRVTNEYPTIAGYLFKLRDGRFDEAMVLKRMDL